MASVSDLITNAQSFATSAYTTASPLVQNAMSAINGYSFYGVGGGVREIEPPAKLLLNAVIPEFQTVLFEAPAEPADPADFRPDPSFEVGTLPVNTAVNPGFLAPPLPAQLASFTGVAPSITTSFAFPSPPPQLQNPSFTVPTIVDRTAPTKPSVVLPVFDATKPAGLPAAPTDYATQFEASYRGIAPTMRASLEAEVTNFLTRYNPRYSEQMASIEDRLAKYIQGGSALSPAVEDAIYSRTTRKVDAEYMRVRDAAATDAAKMGFTMPSGSMMTAMRRARQGAADNSTLAATEIAVKQAELEQTNLQFAVTTSTQLRTTMLNASLSYHSNLVQINGQALDYAKSVLSAMIEVYNTLVRAYTAQLEGYKAEASVYENRVRGALALVEIYRAEIDGFKAIVEADFNKVKVYQAQIDALNSLASMYRTQVDTVVSQASLEKLKLDLFGAQVEAFRSQAAAKASEYQGYTAAISGEEGKIRAYGEQVRAYGTEVDAYRAKVAAKTAEVQSAVSYNEGVVRRYQASVEAYRALVAGRANVVTANIESQKSQLLAAQARFGAEEARGKYGIEYYKARTMSNIEAYKADVSAIIEGAKITTSQMKAIADVSLGGAKVYGDLANAALSGVNTLVSQSQAD